eukprot:scaffold77415_cov28-Phaeocystis_antarctica.AAC.1
MECGILQRGPFLSRSSGGLIAGRNDYHRPAGGSVILFYTSLPRTSAARKYSRSKGGRYYGGRLCYIRLQVWCTQMYSKSVVGLANATSAGWGNMGGGVTNLVMPFVFSAIYNLLDGTPAHPNRVAACDAYGDSLDAS